MRLIAVNNCTMTTKDRALARSGMRPGLLYRRDLQQHVVKDVAAAAGAAPSYRLTRPVCYTNPRNPVRSVAMTT